jgi:hypothetical protein
LSEFREYTFEELFNAEEWSIRPPGELLGTPIAISERQAIEIAMRAICAEYGTSRCRPNRLKRPKYRKRIGDERRSDGRQGPDEWGWHFWIDVPMPYGFEDRSYPLFVNDPSGIVETGPTM